MKLERSDLILYSVALLSAVIAVVLVYGYVENRVAEVQSQVEVKTVTVIEKPELRSIVVASRDLYRGEKIALDDIKVLKVPIEGVTTTGVIVDPEQVVGRVAMQPMFAGEWMIDKKVGIEIITTEVDGEVAVSVLDKPKGQIETLLKPDMRAMRVPVNAQNGLLGMLNPTDHVDIISVFDSADGKRKISRTILQNIEVLSIGQTNRLSRVDDEVSKEGAKEHSGEAFAKQSMVALHVDIHQAEQLALALSVGKIHLMLRGPSDVNIINTDGVNVKVIERAKQSAPVYKSKANRDVIQIIQGDTVQEVKIR